MQDGVEGDVDAGVEAVGELHQAGDLAHRVAGVVARAERRPADVDGVGAVQDRLAADRGGLGRGEEFEAGTRSGHGSDRLHGVPRRPSAEVRVATALVPPVGNARLNCSRGPVGRW